MNTYTIWRSPTVSLELDSDFYPATFQFLWRLKAASLEAAWAAADRPELLVQSVAPCVRQWCYGGLKVGDIIVRHTGDNKMLSPYMVANFGFSWLPLEVARHLGRSGEVHKFLNGVGPAPARFQVPDLRHGVAQE